LELIFFGDILFGVTLFGVISNGGSLTVNQQCPFPVFNWFCELLTGTCDILAITELLLFLFDQLLLSSSKSGGGVTGY
jgi:hypothetical protein